MDPTQYSLRSRDVPAATTTLDPVQAVHTPEGTAKSDVDEGQVSSGLIALGINSSMAGTDAAASVEKTLSLIHI